MADTPNPFVWYELMTTDLDGAERFYGEVVGWTAKDAGMPGYRYTLLSAGQHQVAGAMTRPADAAGMNPTWFAYLAVTDVDETAAEVAAAGGRVLRQPADIPGVGRFTVVADPQGAAFMLFRPKGGAPVPVAPMTPGHAGWHELVTSDCEAAWAFYAGRFGWTKSDTLDMGPMGSYQLFATGGMPVGGMMNAPDTAAPPAWRIYFTVPDIQGAIERVKAGGGTVSMGPVEVPGGAWIIQGIDPQGAAFALVAPPRSAQS